MPKLCAPRAFTVKNAIVYLRHIAATIRRIDSFMPADKESFLCDAQCQDAVMRNLVVIGEATKKLPRSIRDSYPQVPWKGTAGDGEKINTTALSALVTEAVALNPLTIKKR